MKGPQPTPWLQAIPLYSPGISKQTIRDMHGVAQPIKLASNENALGPSPEALKAISNFKEEIHLYPDPQSALLRNAAANFFACSPDRIIAGNGSDEIFDLICRAFIQPNDKVIIPEITFSYYRIASMACGAQVLFTKMRDNQAIDTESIEQAFALDAKIVFIANPNNPTGKYLNRDELLHLLEITPKQTLIVIDEAYASFARADDFLSALDVLEEYQNLIVAKTLSKSHGLAGLRVGFGMAQEQLLESLLRIKPPFNVNILAEKAGAAALSDTPFLTRTLETTWEGLDYFYDQFDRLGLEYVPSQTNFVLLRLGRHARDVYQELLRRGIITRYMNAPELMEYIRITTGLPHESQAFIAALEDVL